MVGPRAAAPTPKDDDLPSVLPRVARRPWILPAAMVGLLAVDRICWHGLLFGSRTWHMILWILVFCGVAIGGFAYWRRER